MWECVNVGELLGEVRFSESEYILVAQKDKRALIKAIPDKSY